MSSLPLSQKKILIFLAGLMLTLTPFFPRFIQAATFPDVEALHKNFSAVEYLAAIGTLKGYPDGTFKPDNTINRAELMKVLVAGQGYTPQVNTYHDCFPDVQKDWYAPYVCFAKEKGWVSGYPDGTFLPGNPVNRVEALKMAINALGLSSLLPEKITTALFDDTNNAEWYAPYLYVSKDLNLIEEQSGNYYPSNGMARSVVAENLFRTDVVASEAEDDCNNDSNNNGDCSEPSGWTTYARDFLEEAAEQFLEDNNLGDVIDEIKQAQQEAENENNNDDTPNTGDDDDSTGGSSTSGTTIDWDTGEESADDFLDMGDGFNLDTNGEGRVWYGWAQTSYVNYTEDDEKGRSDETDVEYVNFRLDEGGNNHWLYLTELQATANPASLYMDNELYNITASSDVQYDYSTDEAIKKLTHAGTIYTDDQRYTVGVGLDAEDVQYTDERGNVIYYFPFRVGSTYSDISCTDEQSPSACTFYVKNGMMEGSFIYNDVTNPTQGLEDGTSITVNWKIYATTCSAFSDCVRPASAKPPFGLPNEPIETVTEPY